MANHPYNSDDNKKKYLIYEVPHGHNFWPAADITSEAVNTYRDGYVKGKVKRTMPGGGAHLPYLGREPIGG